MRRVSFFSLIIFFITSCTLFAGTDDVEKKLQEIIKSVETQRYTLMVGGNKFQEPLVAFENGIMKVEKKTEPGRDKYTTYVIIDKIIRISVLDDDGKITVRVFL